MSNDNNISQMQSGISFLELVKDKKILIPEIQRDYAQGRLDPKASRIRDEFLTALIDTLTSDNGDPLLLDFIYGSTHKNNIFTPLDGQQRLTTLFLLHWYFIPKDKLSLLYIKDNNSHYSRFSYETRISSKDFCDALVMRFLIDLKKELNSQIEDIGKGIQDIEKEIEDEQESDKNNIDKHFTKIMQLKVLKGKACLSDTIKNQPWFLWLWRKDPTIKAMLVMLDEIDKRLGNIDDNQRNSIWENLESGKIVFHLLPLEQFALSDELYVKMNARGKELSSFDIFKSTLEEQMRLNEVSEEVQNEWRNNIDSNWIDLFWNKLAKPHINDETKLEDQIKYVNSVEEGYLRFLKRMMVIYLLENKDSITFDLKNQNTKRLIPFEEFDETNIINKIKDEAVRKDVTILIPLFNKIGFFNQKFYTFIIDTFKSLTYIRDNVKHDGSDLIYVVKFDKEGETLFNSFIKSTIDYEVWLQFYSLLQFYKYNKASLVNDNPNLTEELISWMRIIRNLTTITNVFIDDIDDFFATLDALKNWSNEIYGNDVPKSVIEYFSNNFFDHKPKGRLVAPQFVEEIQKSLLITQSENKDEWIKEIREIEEHKYFLGQINFLLEWSKKEDGHDIEIFKRYKQIINSVFSEKGLIYELSNRETHLFRNCLMANCENYLLNNDCFVDDTGKARDRSWKSYLRNTNKSQNIKLIFDKYHEKGGTFKDFCENEVEIGISAITDWRRCFLNKPEIYNRCEKNQIDYWNESKMEVCLLETSMKWTGNNRHSELNTFYWSLKFERINEWNIKYHNSQKESPLVAIFTKNNLRIETVFKKITDSWKYVITLNYDPFDQEYSKENEFWNRHFESTDYLKVESELEKLLK